MSPKSKNPEFTGTKYFASLFSNNLVAHINCVFGCFLSGHLSTWDLHYMSQTAHCNTLQHTATHCNTLQHTATHCNTLQHTVISGHLSSWDPQYMSQTHNTRSIIERCIAVYCSELQCVAVCCSVLQKHTTRSIVERSRGRIRHTFSNASSPPIVQHTTATTAIKLTSRILQRVCQEEGAHALGGGGGVGGGEATPT